MRPLRVIGEVPLTDSLIWLVAGIVYLTKPFRSAGLSAGAEQAPDDDGQAGRGGGEGGVNGGTAGALRPTMRPLFESAQRGAPEREGRGGQGAQARE